MQTETGNTIENKLQDALRATSLIPPTAKLTDMAYTRAGRTDAGVSASKQIISLFIRSKQKLPETCVGYTPQKDSFKAAPPPWQAAEPPRYFYEEHEKELFLDELDYISAINSKLPADIRVLSWAPAPLDFNARFCADSRTYEYTIDKAQLNLEKMSEAAKKFLGEHDFRNFCKMDLENVNSFIRQVHSIQLLEEHRALVIRITGSAFLWHQVRCMVSLLLMIGQCHEEPELIDQLLDLKIYPSKPNYTMAADYPLCLVDTEYKLFDFGLSKSALNMGALLIHAHREKAALLTKALQWEALINRHLNNASMIREDHNLVFWEDHVQSNPIYTSPAFYPVTLVSPTTKHQKIADRPRDPSYEEKMAKRRRD